MEDQNRNGEGVPPQCKCGFFGNRLTMNMCSRCYHDYVNDHPEVSRETNPIDNLKTEHVEQRPRSAPPLSSGAKIQTSTAIAKADPEKTATDSIPKTSAPEGSSMKKNRPTRCKSCHKKVGIMGFKCKCGGMFCPAHRHFIDHDCSYNYAQAGKKKLQEANPLVKASQIDEF